MQSRSTCVSVFNLLKSDRLPLEMKHHIVSFLDQETLVFALEFLLTLPVSQRVFELQEVQEMQEVMAGVLKVQQKWTARLTTIYQRVLSDDHCTGCGKRKVLCPPNWHRWRRCVDCLSEDDRVDLWTTTQIREHEKRNGLKKESLAALTRRCGRMRAHINDPFNFMYSCNSRPLPTE